MASPLIRSPLAAFRPWRIPNLFAWWSADVPSSMFQASAGTTAVAANNDPVGYWADLLNGYTLTQSTNNNRPLWLSAGINSLPALSFDGVNDYFSASSGSVLNAARSVSGFTAVAVMSPSYAGNSGGNQSWTIISRNGSAVQGRFHAYMNNTGGGRNTQLTARRLDSDSAVTVFSAGFSSANENAIAATVATYSAGTGTFFKNGTAVSTQGLTSSGTTADTASNSVGIGSLSDGTSPYGGKLAQVLWYQRALSASEILYLSRWLGRIYGVAV